MARRLITFYNSISSLPSIALGLLLLTHAVLLSVLGARYAPTIDERAHLVVGLSHWQQSHFSLYRVNPLLIRMLATAPLLLDPPEMDWSVFDKSSSSRPEFIAGDELTLRHGSGCLRYFVIARRSLIIVSLMGWDVLSAFFGPEHSTGPYRVVLRHHRQPVRFSIFDVVLQSRCGRAIECKKPLVGFECRLGPGFVAPAKMD